MRNAAAILPLKSKLSGKFQRFSAINRRIEILKLVEFSKISMKIKNYKTFWKAQTPNGLKKCIQSPGNSPKFNLHHLSAGFTIVMLTRIFFANEIFQRQLSLNKNSVMAVNRRQYPVSDSCKNQKCSGLHPKYYFRNSLYFSKPVAVITYAHVFYSPTFKIISLLVHFLIVPHPKYG